MDRFETVMSRHGEQGVQAILENWERFVGIKHSCVMPLERRWEMFIQETSEPIRAAA